ncbi:MAG: phosphatase PAP2 family protein [Acidimicrobiia bacterium]
MTDLGWSDRVAALDDAVEAWLEPRRSPALDRVFYSLSSAADHSILWHACGSVRAARRGDPAIALRLSALLGVESGLTNGAIKSFFRRVRPVPETPPGEPLPYGMRRPITSSFPSGHATAAFTAATLLTRRGTGSRPLFFGLAALVSASRVYVRMHHLSDVVVGAALGLVFGRVFARVLPIERTR